jgi:hypothetical protein
MGIVIVAGQIGGVIEKDKEANAKNGAVPGGFYVDDVVD